MVPSNGGPALRLASATISGQERRGAGRVDVDHVVEAAPQGCRRESGKALDLGCVFHAVGGAVQGCQAGGQLGASHIEFAIDARQVRLDRAQSHV